ncbi:MAG: N-acetyltransferase [Porticoccaceae bacterium]|nr:N-acetyltransferase [Porticoccaceae bacterium]
MQIRESNDSDKENIRTVHLESFGQSEGPIVSQLTIDLLEDKTAQPLLSLVAEQDHKILGHSLFTRITLEGEDINHAYILAPLAVAPDSQGEGVGTALIEQSLKTLKKRNGSFVMVLGDPKYYSRTGFKADYKIRPPHKIQFPEAWMSQELRVGALENISGVARCASVLNKPEHW